MTEKKRIYETDLLALPPLRLVLGEVPSPDPDQKRKHQNKQTTNKDMEISIKKLIAHLKENEGN